jgi:hypothetical protein
MKIMLQQHSTAHTAQHHARAQKAHYCPAHHVRHNFMPRLLPSAHLHHVSMVRLGRLPLAVCFACAGTHCSAQKAWSHITPTLSFLDPCKL